MGYTHYFPQKESVHVLKWTKITEDLKLVLGNLPPFSQTAGGYHQEPIDLRSEYDEPNPPELGHDYIRFNGEGDLGHETFYMPRVKEEGDSFMFCKTARKPYDHVVCAALIIANHHAPECFDIGSDGGPEDWMPALEHVRSVLNNPEIQLPPCFAARESSVEPAQEDELSWFNTSNQWFFH